MISDLAWNLTGELFVSCSPNDIDDDFHRAEKQVHEIVDRTGLSPAQRKRLRADVIKAALHGFGQIAKAGDCISIIIQMYIKAALLDDANQRTLGSKDIGWGYFLIERVADRQVGQRDVRAVDGEGGLAAAGLENDARLAGADDSEVGFAAGDGDLLVVGPVGDADGVTGGGRVDGRLDGGILRRHAAGGG